MEKIYYILLLFSFLSLAFLSWQDIKSQQISRDITLATVFIVLIFNSVALIFYDYEPAYQALSGALLLGSSFLAILLITKEKGLGMGDVYLFILMGLLVGIQNIFLSLSIMVFTALLYSVVKYKKIEFKQKIPLVPFITIGIFSTIILNLLLL